MKFKNFVLNNKILLVTTFLIVLGVVSWGFSYGRHDQSIYIPFISNIIDQNTYSNDPMMTMMDHESINFWKLASPFLHLVGIETGLFLLYFFSILLLVFSFYLLAKKIFKNRIAGYLAGVFAVWFNPFFFGPMSFNYFAPRVLVVSLSLIGLAIYINKKDRYLNKYIGIFITGLAMSLHMIFGLVGVSVIAMDILLSFLMKNLVWKDFAKRVFVLLFSLMPLILMALTRDGARSVNMLYDQTYHNFQLAVLPTFYDFNIFTTNIGENVRRIIFFLGLFFSVITAEKLRTGKLPILKNFTESVPIPNSIALQDRQPKTNMPTISHKESYETYKGVSKKTSHGISEEVTTLRNFIIGGAIFILVVIIVYSLNPAVIFLELQLTRAFSVVGVFISILVAGLISFYFIRSDTEKNSTFVAVAATTLQMAGQSFLALLILTKNKIANRVFLSILTILSFSVLTIVILGWNNMINFSINSPTTKTNPLYDEIQLWAQNNTPEDSLFIVPVYFDDNSMNQFRILSKRSCLASLSELWLISIDRTYWEELIPRYDDLTQGKISQVINSTNESKKPTYSEIYEALYTGYRSNSGDDFLRIGWRYGADYVITEIDQPLDLPIVYSNEGYFVYGLR